MLIANKEKKPSNNKEWAESRRIFQSERFVAAYEANDNCIPACDTREYSWIKKNRDMQTELENKGVDFSRNTFALQQQEIWERIVENYFWRDRMPGKANPSELTDYEYCIDHQSDIEFQNFLAEQGVDRYRTLDVVNQEENLEQYQDWVEGNARTPKGQRHKISSKKFIDLPPDLQKEDFLYRWQYNVLRDDIICLKYCRMDVKAIVEKLVRMFQ